MGCTEPIAIALACAKGGELLSAYAQGEPLEHITLKLSSNVLKNAMGVGIPGTDRVGIPIAAALGAFGGTSEKALEVLTGITPEAVAAATQFIDQETDTIDIEVAGTQEKLYIDATLATKQHTVRVCISGSHTHITHLSLDGTPLPVQQDSAAPAAQPETPNLSPEQENPLSKSELLTMLNCPTSIADIYAFSQTIALDKVEFVYQGALLNKKIAEEGLQHDYGHKVGKTIQRNIARNILSDDMKNYAVAVTAAAADARMAGCLMPVMTNSGSGNQGITVSLPIVAVGEKLQISREKLTRALVLGNLIAIHIKRGIGKLSALCGAGTAAIGAGCGIVCLFGGGLTHCHAVIQNMIGDLTGIICDGAKTGCSLKVASVVEAAFSSALLALDNIAGICGGRHETGY